MVSLSGIPSSTQISASYSGNGYNSASTHPYEKCTEGVLGKGAYGTVYKGTDRNNPDRSVALKEIKIQLNTDEGIPMNALREIGLLKQLDKYNHPNVVRLLDVCPGARSHREMKLMLVFEHIDQDLAQFLERSPPPGLAPGLIKHIFHEILAGVDFIHMHRIIHRDLKPQNILIGAGGRQVKLADFGLARVYGYQMALTSVVVTLYYRAPEVLLQDEYSLPIDLWSCGCILAELYSGRALFKGSSELEQLCKIFEYLGVPSETEWPERLSLPRTSFRPTTPQPIETLVPDLEPEAIDLIEKLLVFSPRDRLTALQALSHSYFSDSESDSVTSVELLNRDARSPSATNSRADDVPLALPLLSKTPRNLSTFGTPTALPSSEHNNNSAATFSEGDASFDQGDGLSAAVLPCYETLEDMSEDFCNDNLHLLASAAEAVSFAVTAEETHVDTELYADDI